MRSATLVLLAAAALMWAAPAAQADPFSVGTIPAESDWTLWGYTVDGQPWANWLVVDIPWGSEASMSGTYYLQEDFLFWVDPSTSGLADPHLVYDADWWNHDGVYGLGEFFDAGKQPGDRNYSLILTLGATDTWAVFYDGNRNQLIDGAADHIIFGGTVTSYWERNGRFYGVLTSDDGTYDGFFTSSHDEGTPELMDSVFHAGYGQPVPEPGTLLLCAGALACAARRRRRRALRS